MSWVPSRPWHTDGVLLALARVSMTCVFGRAHAPRQPARQLGHLDEQLRSKSVGVSAARRSHPHGWYDRIVRHIWGKVLPQVLKRGEDLALPSRETILIFVRWVRSTVLANLDAIRGLPHWQQLSLQQGRGFAAPNSILSVLLRRP